MHELEVWTVNDIADGALHEFADPAARGLGLEGVSLPFEVVVSRFPRYGRTTASLPAPERAKIARIARFVVHGLRSGRRPIRTIRLVGHADVDTPRRPAFEHQIAHARANDVLLALLRALDRGEGGSGRAVPPYSARVAWEIHSAGASRPVVPKPLTELYRSRNRRVEISLIPYSGSAQRGVHVRGVRFGFASLALPSRLQAAIDDFLRRAPNDSLRYDDPVSHIRDLPDRRICVQAVATKAIQLCKTANASDRDVPCAPPLTLTRGRCLSVTRGIEILDGKEYRPPIAAAMRCCDVSTPCRRPMDQACAHCRLGTLPPGHYLLLKYKSRPLARMVENLKCLLDRGCAIPLGVMSGICDDKPDRTCTAAPANRWRDCWEHWLLVIGYEGNRFVFWDSAQASANGPKKPDKDNHWFGVLFYDSKNDRLSTATTDPSVDGLEVSSDGYHTQGFAPGSWPQKRYQVVSMWPGLPWNAVKRSCLLGKA
jgi:outer membrane protein OmpA-like peptidoglycan-associated protein